MEAFGDCIINMTQKLKFGLQRVENIVGKKRKWWQTAFYPFPTIFSKGLFIRFVKNQDCMLKG